MATMRPSGGVGNWASAFGRIAGFIPIHSDEVGVRPHPFPLPPGKGDRLAARLQTIGHLLSKDWRKFLPLPGGEGRGEGEPNYQLHGLGLGRRAPQDGAGQPRYRFRSVANLPRERGVPAFGRDAGFSMQRKCWTRFWSRPGRHLIGFPPRGDGCIIGSG